MRPDEWHLTGDVGEFLARAGDFLRSRPAHHTMQLTTAETLRRRGARAEAGSGAGVPDAGDPAPAPVFGMLERAGEIQAVFYRVPPRSLILSALTAGEADALAARLDGLGHRFPGVSGERDTAVAFAEAWRRRTGALPALRAEVHLHRLGTLTPPDPFPAGRARVATEGAGEGELLLRWYNGFAESVGHKPFATVDAWAKTHGYKRFVLWETPDGAPVSMAATTPPAGGQIRVDPVYTPSHLRGRGYGAAVTVAASRAAREAGATEVVLFSDAANPTSNRLYQRLGYRRIADFAVYDFTSRDPAS